MAANPTPPSTVKTVVQNVSWALTGKLVQLLGGFLVGVFVARYLGPDQYGLMNYVISYISLFSVLANFGMDNIEVRELSKANHARDVLMGTALTLKLCFAAATILLVFVTTLLFEADRFTLWMIMLYSLSMVLNSFLVIRNYFTSIVQNKYVVLTEISRTLIGAGIKVVLLLLHAPLVWFIAAVTFDTCLIAGGLLMAYRTRVGSVRAWRFDSTVARYLVKQSFPLLLSGAAVIVYQKIDQVMIGNLIDKTSVGYYAVAERFVDIALFIPLIIAQTVTPILVRIREASVADYRARSQQFMNLVLWGAIGVSIAVSLVAYWLVKYTFGANYMAAVPVLQIMVFKSVGMALSASSGQLIIIEGIHQWAFFRNIIGTVVCVGLNLWLIPRYGIIGSALASIVTVLCTGFIANSLIRPYRHLFRMQLTSFYAGWLDVMALKQFLPKKQ